MAYNKPSPKVYKEDVQKSDLFNVLAPENDLQDRFPDMIVSRKTVGVDRQCLREDEKAPVESELSPVKFGPDPEPGVKFEPDPGPSCSALGDDNGEVPSAHLALVSRDHYQKEHRGKGDPQGRTLRKGWTGKPRFVVPAKPEVKARLLRDFDAQMASGMLALGLATGDLSKLFAARAFCIAKIDEMFDAYLDYLCERPAQFNEVYIHEVMDLESAVSLQNKFGAVTLRELSEESREDVANVEGIYPRVLERIEASFRKHGLEFSAEVSA